MTALGSLIRERREALGLPQSALAGLLTAYGFKASQSKIWSLESGTYAPRLTEAAVLARALDMTLDEMAAGDLPPAPCSRCLNSPPSGYACLLCGRDAP